MMKLLKIKNIHVYLIVIILITLLLNLMFSDSSNVQSAHDINIVITPCSVVSDSQVETNNFNQSNTPQICGEVFSEYMPLELEYDITNLDNNETVLFCEYVKIMTRNFTLALPDNLDAGNYKFELKAGCKKLVAETNFVVLP